MTVVLVQQREKSMELNMGILAKKKGMRWSSHLGIKEDQVSVFYWSMVGPSTEVPQARNKDTDGPLLGIVMDLSKQRVCHLQEQRKAS